MKRARADSTFWTGYNEPRRLVGELTAVNCLTVAAGVPILKAAVCEEYPRFSVHFHPCGVRLQEPIVG
jgi:hypothetical protein